MLFFKKKPKKVNVKKAIVTYVDCEGKDHKVTFPGCIIHEGKKMKPFVMSGYEAQKYIGRCATQDHFLPLDGGSFINLNYVKFHKIEIQDHILEM